MRVFDKACTDFMSASTMAFAAGTDAEQDTAKLNWADVAARFRTNSCFDESDKVCKSKRYHRTKVYRWLCAANHMLQAASSQGFERVQIGAWRWRCGLGEAAITDPGR